MTHYLHNGQLFEIDRMPPDERDYTVDFEGIDELERDTTSFVAYLSTLQPIPHELKGEGVVVEGKDFEWRYGVLNVSGEWVSCLMREYERVPDTHRRRVAVPIEAKEVANERNIACDWWHQHPNKEEIIKRYWNNPRDVKSFNETEIWTMWSLETKRTTPPAHSTINTPCASLNAGKQCMCANEGYDMTQCPHWIRPAPSAIEGTEKPWPGNECGLSEFEWQMGQVIDEIRSKETSLECMAPLVKFLQSQSDTTRQQTDEEAAERIRPKGVNRGVRWKEGFIAGCQYLRAQHPQQQAGREALQHIWDYINDFFKYSEYRGQYKVTKYGGSLVIKFDDGTKAKLELSMWQGDQVTLDAAAPPSSVSNQVAKELKEIRDAFQWTFDNMGTPHTSDHFNVPANAIEQLDNLYALFTSRPGEQGDEAKLRNIGEWLADWILSRGYATKEQLEEEYKQFITPKPKQ